MLVNMRLETETVAVITAVKTPTEVLVTKRIADHLSALYLVKQVSAMYPNSGYTRNTTACRPCITRLAVTIVVYKTYFSFTKEMWTRKQQLMMTRVGRWNFITTSRTVIIGKLV